MSDFQYQAVYNRLSLALASMMATTLFLWLRSFAVQDRYRSAVLISGMEKMKQQKQTTQTTTNTKTKL